MRRVVDLHCDLLAYLAESKGRAAALDPRSRCSLGQLRLGNVAVQTCAIFTETLPGSTRRAAHQHMCWRQCIESYRDRVKPFDNVIDPERISLVLALENGSALLEETESIVHLAARLKSYCPLLYVSLTWNGENRFGGGCGTRLGLKPDGKLLLELLAQENIAVDLSHASYWLASDVLETIDKEHLSLTPIASHSNFQAVKEVERNLPDPVAKEIIARGGLIGMNLFRHFVGESVQHLVDHVEHGLQLGGQRALCFGADFFGGIPMTTSDYKEPHFFSDAGSAAAYPHCLARLDTICTHEQVEQIAALNALDFMTRSSALF